MTDTKRIKELIYGNNLNMVKVAKKLGISAANFADKVNGRKEFRGEDIRLFRELFSLSDADVCAIFFR